MYYVSFIVHVLTRIQIATPKWNCQANIILRHWEKHWAVKVKRKGRIRDLFSQLLTLIACFTFSQQFATRHAYTLSARIEKHLYVPRRAHCEKNTTTLNAKHTLVTTMFTDALHKCVMQCFSFTMPRFAGENTIFRWHRLVLVRRRIILDISNIHGAPLPALPLPPIVRANFLYLYMRGEVEYRSSEWNR